MFDPIDFLSLAEDLIRNEISEAKIRTSIGRSYYASFLYARKVAGLTSLRTPEVHRKVVRFLYVKEPAIANRLHLLRRFRDSADHNLDYVLEIDKAKECVKLAKSIVEAL
jgi:uncharacterized protein (UPF0332 family)